MVKRRSPFCGMFGVVWIASCWWCGMVRPFIAVERCATFWKTVPPGIYTWKRCLPYAPDLNPDEGVWRYTKCVELRNVCCLNLDDLRAHVRNVFGRLRQRPRLIRSFFAEAKLALEMFSDFCNSQYFDYL